MSEPRHVSSNLNGMLNAQKDRRRWHALWWVCLFTFVVGVVVPLAWARFVPLQDLPAHVETACQLLRARAGLAPTLMVHTQPWANSLPTELLAVLLQLVPDFAAAKLLLAIATLLWPASLLLLCTSLGWSRFCVLLVLPTAFDLAFGYGFLHFTCGKPLLALCLVAVVWAARSEGRARRVALTLLLLLLSLTFVVHSLVWLLALVITTTWIVATGLWRQWRTLLTIVASTAVALPFFWATRATHHQGHVRFRSAWALWASIAEDSFDVVRDTDWVSHMDAAPWVVVFMWAVWWWRCWAKAQPRTPASRETVAMLSVAVVLLCGWAFLPEVLPQVSVVSPRLLSLAVAFLLLATPVPHTSSPQRLALVLSLALAANAVAMTRAWQRFSRDDMGDFDGLLASLPANARVATQYAATSSPHAPHNALWHWGKLSCLRGGETDDTFALRETAFVEVEPRAKAAYTPHRLRPDALRRYDALLVAGDAARSPPPEWQPVFRAGRFVLFSRAPLP